MTIGAFTHLKLPEGTRTERLRSVEIVTTRYVVVFEENFAGTKLVDGPARRTENFDGLIEAATFGLGDVNRNVVEIDLEELADLIDSTSEWDSLVSVPRPPMLVVTHHPASKSDQATTEISFAFVGVALPIPLSGMSVRIDIDAVLGTPTMNGTRPDISLTILSEIKVQMVEEPIHPTGGEIAQFVEEVLVQIPIRRLCRRARRVVRPLVF